MMNVNLNFMRISGILAVAAVLVVLLVLTRPETRAELQPLPPSRVLLDTVRLMDIQPVTVITGRLQPVRKAHLRFEVSAQLIERLVEPGQIVFAGELLLKIEDGDFLDSVDEARAILLLEEEAIDRDRRLLELSIKQRALVERELQRLRQLGKESLASRSNYDEVEQRLLRQQADEASLRHSVGTSVSRLQTRRAALNRAQRNLRRTRLVAPFAATVNAVNVGVGDYVSSGQPAIDLVQLDELDLSLEVTGTVVSSLSLGRVINVTIGEHSRTGKIVAMAADPDANTNTYALRIRLSGSGLFAGQLARAELPGEFMSQVPVVPLTAVLREEGNNYVFRLSNGHVVKTPIRLIKRHQDLQVIDGLPVNTRIVANDVAALADQQAVSVE